MIILTLAVDMFDQRTAAREVTVPWPDFVASMTTHDRRPSKEARAPTSPAGLGFTLARFAPGACACGKRPVGASKGCPDYGGATAHGHRIDRNVLEVTALGIDIDKRVDGSPLDESGRDAALAALAPYRSVVYSTHSYAPPAKCSLRAIVALSRPVPRADWVRFRDAALARIGVVPGCTHDPRRFWYAPSAPSAREGAEVLARAFDGAPIDVDAVLASIPPEVPRPPREVRELAPGDFDVRAAMAAWYPEADEVAQSDDESYWDLDECPWAAEHTGGAGGARVYTGPDGHGFSCFHAHCAGRRWGDFRALHDPGYLTPAQAARDAVLFEALAAPDPVTPGNVIDQLIADAAPAPGSFAEALVVALTDVRRALAMSVLSGAVEPLFVPSSEIHRREYGPTPWLVQSLATRGAVWVIGGEAKTSKTWLATEVAVAVATGTPVCEYFAVEAPATVAYFYAEDLDRQVRNRQRALCAARGIDPATALGRLHVQPRGRFLDVLRDDDVALIVASCRAIGDVGLLVLEPLRDLHGGEEDKSDSMRDVMRRLRVIGELLGCTVLVAHHSGKVTGDTAKRRGGQKLRGSGAIHGSIDAGTYLSGLTGDGERVFGNKVEAECKGARSAGYFDLTLTVEDDAGGEAVRATWKVTRGDAAKEAEKDASKEAMVSENIVKVLKTLYVAEANGQAPPTLDEVRKAIGSGKKETSAALKTATERGLIRQNYHGLAPSGWLLMPEGRVLVEPVVAAERVRVEAARARAEAAVVEHLASMFAATVPDLRGLVGGDDARAIVDAMIRRGDLVPAMGAGNRYQLRAGFSPDKG